MWGNNLSVSIHNVLKKIFYVQVRDVAMVIQLLGFYVKLS
jgi:hypothetical protein